ncbi:MAG: cytochrome P450 [Solirubrobacteraceae bacterium]
MAPSSTMPPGPPLPRLLQTAALLLAGTRFLETCQRRYGDLVTVSTVFDERLVMVFSPALLHEIFTAPGEQLRAGEANVLLGPVLGQRSLLLLDGAEHLRQRRLMLGPFHGARMLAQLDTIRACADAEIDSWPVGEPFALLPRMRALTLAVILRVVFGRSDAGPERGRLAARLREMIEPLSRPGGVIALAAIIRGAGGRRSARAFSARRRAVHELVAEEIARRRADPHLQARDDVFSALLLARDEQGRGLSDEEVRDQLLTLLLAGHETTATGLAWTFDLVLRDARVRERAAALDDRYLDAVVKEALRIRSVIPLIGRVVRERPFALAGYEIPVGAELDPSIRTIHRRADLYPDPGRFLPERFLGLDAPDTYTWTPFGGGTRRCLGASFAQAEMRIVLGRVLARAALSLVDRRPARAQFRGIVLAPRGGVRVIARRAPLSPPSRATWRSPNKLLGDA